MDDQCEECSFPAVDVARVEFDDVVIDRKLCRQHLDALMRGARPMFETLSIDRPTER